MITVILNKQWRIVGANQYIRRGAIPAVFCIIKRQHLGCLIRLLTVQIYDISYITPAIKDTKNGNYTGVWMYLIKNSEMINRKLMCLLAVPRLPVNNGIPEWQKV